MLVKAYKIDLENMKIIGWNCNGAYRNKSSEILALKPDLVVVSECENIERLKLGKKVPIPNQVKWFGDNPNKGIGVFSYSDYTFELISHYNPEYKYIIPLIVKNESYSFILFCIWTKDNNLNKERSYIGQVWFALEYYSNLLEEKEIILIGDLNSNKIWDSKRPYSNHTRVVEFLKKYSIESLYHMQYREAQGKETQPTFFLHKNEKKPYHIDYCFASENIHKFGFNFEIGRRENWINLSDHVPVVVYFKWTPSGSSIENSLYKLVEDKLNQYDLQKKEGLDQIKMRILNRAKTQGDDQILNEEERLNIIRSTEDFLTIIELLKKINRRDI